MRPVTWLSTIGKQGLHVINALLYRWCGCQRDQRYLARRSVRAVVVVIGLSRVLHAIPLASRVDLNTGRKRRKVSKKYKQCSSLSLRPQSEGPAHRQRKPPAPPTTSTT